MSKMIKCKVCNEEIGAGAKTCPKCGSKNKKPFYKKWWVWVLAVILISAVASNGGEQKQPSKTEKTEEKKETVFNVADTVNTEKFEITVTKVETAKIVGGEYFKEEPSEGGIFVIVNWEYKNISDSPVSAFSCPTIRLADKNDTKYDSDLNATSSYSTQVNLDSKILSDLNPNIKVKDAVVFEISEEAYNEGGFSILVNADSDFKVNIN